MTPKPADFGYAVQKFHVARGQRKVENVKVFLDSRRGYRFRKGYYALFHTPADKNLRRGFSVARRNFFHDGNLKCFALCNGCPRLNRDVFALQ